MSKWAVVLLAVALLGGGVLVTELVNLPSAAELRYKRELHTLKELELQQRRIGDKIARFEASAGEAGRAATSTASPYPDFRPAETAIAKQLREINARVKEQRVKSAAAAREWKQEQGKPPEAAP